MSEKLEKQPEEISEQPESANHQELELEKSERIAKEIFSDAEHKNEVLVVPSKKSEGVNIKITIEPNEKEKTSGDFAISIDTDAIFLEMRLPGQEVNSEGFICNNAQFTIAGRKIKFEEICPEGTNLYIFLHNSSFFSREECGFYDPKKGGQNGGIFLENFYSPSTFISMLHEVGHAIEYSKKSKEEIERLQEARGENEEERAKINAIEERNAWANVLKTAKKYDLPISDQIQKIAEIQLTTYQKSVEKLNLDFPINNEARKIKRKNRLDNR